VKRRRVVRVVVTEEVVVWCVEVVVAGDGDDDRMGLLGESGASSRLAARTLARSSGSRPSAETQPGMRSSPAACLSPPGGQ
jgi:hypothetical protein